jgi:hypothetical protein
MQTRGKHSILMVRSFSRNEILASDLLELHHDENSTAGMLEIGVGCWMHENNKYENVTNR